MIGLTLKFENIFLGIVLLQPLEVVFPTFIFTFLMQMKRSFFFGTPEPLTMFVMVVKVTIVNSSIFINVFLLTFMLDFP